MELCDYLWTLENVITLRSQEAIDELFEKVSSDDATRPTAQQMEKSVGAPKPESQKDEGATQGNKRALGGKHPVPISAETGAAENETKKITEG